jgi:TonB family protein
MPTRRPFSACLFVLLALLITSQLQASDSTNLEQDLSKIFVGRSFTVRNYYRGGRLHFGSNGELLGKSDVGYWSRDGMVKISSVKLSANGELSFQGERYCVLFDPGTGEFLNVKTGDKVELSVDLPPGDNKMEIAIPILYKVFLTGKDRLPDLVPTYWRDCLNQKMARPDKHSPWECVPQDRQLVPDFSGKKVDWDNPLPDRSLHNGTRLYTIHHKVAYLAQDASSAPEILIAPDPVFQWEQRRTVLDATTLILAFTVDEDGKPQSISIVSPVGMGLDDDAVHALEEWKFKPGSRDGKLCPFHARVTFEIGAPNTQPVPR